MPLLYRYMLLSLFFFISGEPFAQTIIRGKVIDASTKEAIPNATVQCAKAGCNCGCATNSLGNFEMLHDCCDRLSVSAVGYASYQFPAAAHLPVISLTPMQSLLQEVVVSSARGEKIIRSEAPIAIASISAKTLQETKATAFDQLLNKVSGVNMVNLGNEQHQMSIRQPMSTKSLFLYLEDGIPVRTSGLYNHNALVEMNLAAVKSIEVIKGPSSSLYGSEAIGGVVNIITLAPTAIPVLKFSAQGNNIGYKRSDLQTSFTTGKWGFVASGYYADKKNGALEYTDYHKGAATARIDYRFSDKTVLSNSLSWINYYSDMSGGVDSIMFAQKTFNNLQTFTYRKVNALRYHSTLTHRWNENSKTTLSLVMRDNKIGQNPAYRVKDDYRPQGAGYIGRKDLAHGEINESSFHSYGFIAQQKQSFSWKNAVFLGGVSMDLSPSDYYARYIRIEKDTVSKKYIRYQQTDSALTDYATRLNNYAAFANFEFNPLPRLRAVVSLRYDLFRYDFDNHLPPSAFSGSPDTISHFSRLSPKIGFTYNFSGRTGLYANYSEGFVPPQVTELYAGVKTPNIKPSIFYNYEIGGWMEIVKDKLSADLSAYRLKGTNEIISVKLEDGAYANQNAGTTMHRGIEFGLTANPAKELTIRFSGAYSKHEFVEYLERGVKYDGNEMNNAPRWMYNTEAWYKPSFIKGFRLGAELQRIGAYFVDPLNTAKYKGYTVLHIRAGYQVKGFDLWVNALNATNNYYSYITSKSSFGYSYQLADPRNFNIGVGYDFTKLFNKQ